MRWPYTCAVAVPSTAPGLAVWATHGLGWPHGLRVALVGGGGFGGKYGSSSRVAAGAGSHR
jgi:hypothetical protein